MAFMPGAVRQPGYKPQMGTGLQGYNAQTNSYLGDVVTDSTSGARATTAAIKGDRSLERGPRAITAKGPSIADLEAKYGRAGYLAAGNAPDTTYTPPAVATDGGGGAGGGGGASAGALGGLAQALGVEDPMSAMSLPVGLREGLGRRSYPTLVNALAGLRY